MLIHGKCHCGNISFSLIWEPDPAEIPARACTCSFCTKHGGLWTSNPRGALKVVVKDPSLVSKYAFGTRTAERSEEHTSELQSQSNLVCRLLLEKKKKK